MNANPIRAVYFNPRVAPAHGLRRGHVALHLVDAEAPIEVPDPPLPQPSLLRSIVVSVLLAALLCVVVLLIGRARPARADPPAPDLLAHEDVLAIARRANAALVVIDARIAWGRGRVEFYKGLRFLSDPAGALGLTHTPTDASSARGTGVGRTRSASVPVGPRLESTETRARGARLETAVRPAHFVNVDSLPGAVPRDRAGLFSEASR